MARVTAELKIEIPPNTEDLIPNGRQEFFDVVETALQHRFGDYFMKAEKGGHVVRCVIFLNTYSGTAGDAGDLLQEMAEAVVREVQEEMAKKLK